MLRKEKLEFETQSHSELCSALAKQADQWQERLTTARKQAEEQRKLISDRYAVNFVIYRYFVGQDLDINICLGQSPVLLLEHNPLPPYFFLSF